MKTFYMTLLAMCALVTSGFSALAVLVNQPVTVTTSAGPEVDTGQVEPAYRGACSGQAVGFEGADEENTQNDEDEDEGGTPPVVAP